MNPKYLPNSKNNYNPGRPKDIRTKMVPIGCGNCMECRRQLANEWKVRLNEEIRTNQGHFVTLTFSEKSVRNLETIVLEEENGDIKELENKVAKKAVRLFLERWRKKHEKSLRHWLITELGHEGTERIHLHGILFTDVNKIAELEKIWSYGWVHIGSYCNEQTINYIVKYVTKTDNDHKGYKSKILCSSGIGSGYLKREKYLNQYNGDETKEYYLLKNGSKMNLPNYYRNHIYTEEQREKLWINKLNKGEIYVNGTKYSVKTSDDIKTYIKALKEAQKINIENGFGKIDWKSVEYKDLLKNVNKY